MFPFPLTLDSPIYLIIRSQWCKHRCVYKWHILACNVRDIFTEICEFSLDVCKCDLFIRSIRHCHDNTQARRILASFHWLNHNWFCDWVESNWYWYNVGRCINISYYLQLMLNVFVRTYIIFWVFIVRSMYRIEWIMTCLYRTVLW